MIELSVSGLVKEFAVGSRLLDGISFQINSGERVGLLGPNGCGKTTLLSILTGSMDYDQGEVVIAPGRRMGLISQIPVYPAGYRVEDVLGSAFAALQEMEQELTRLSGELQHDPSPAQLARYDKLSAALETGGWYEREITINKLCNGLSIPPNMRAQPFDKLSGGEKTRINLARLILEDTDILLLDEPTNHLDLRAVEWLEDYLERFRGTVLTVSHDRYFLDKAAERIIELEQGRAEFYSGNYSFYAVEKEQRRQTQQKQYDKEQSKIRQLEETARVMHQRGTERMHKQAFAMEKRMERIRQTERPTSGPAPLKARFGEREFRGDEVLSLKGVTKSFGARTLFSNLSLDVAGEERIALIGDNGSGKTTLLKMILGEESPESGTIKLGPSVKPAYLPQHVRFDHPERSLVDTLVYELKLSIPSARNRLGAFLFRGEDVFKPVSALSGGEQSRLRLCMLMAEDINFLVLDEPTNHLDLQSREWIETALADYQGNLLFVSHDRYFIERFATRIWSLEEGGVIDFPGNYPSWKQAQAKRLQADLRAKATAGAVTKRGEKKRPGGTKQLEKDVSAAELAVAKAEGQMDALNLQIEQCAADYLKLQALCQERETLETQLAALYNDWEALAAQLEQVQSGG